MNTIEKFKKIQLKGGYVEIPQEWEVLQELGDFKKSTYVGVVEIINSHRSFPHFIFSSNYQYGDEYPNEFIEKIKMACLARHPEIQQVSNDSFHVTHIPDADSFDVYMGYVPYGVSIIHE
jgi:hypothetical protein